MIELKGLQILSKTFTLIVHMELGVIKHQGSLSSRSQLANKAWDEENVARGVGQSVDAVAG